MRFFISVVIYTFCCLPARAASDLQKNAIVRVEVRGETTNGPYVRFGTGFVTGDGRSVITARHLITPQYPWKKDELTQLDRYSVRVVLRGPTGLMDDWRKVTKNSEDENGDIALFQIEQGDSASNRLPTCPDPSLEGNPNLTTFGFASTVDATGNDKSSEDSLSVSSGSLNDVNPQDFGKYRISAQTKPGFSGAPVFLNDQVVGVLTGGSDGRLTSAQVTLFTSLKKLRGKVLATCDAKCRLPSHGIEGYKRHERLSFESDWTTVKATAWQFCDTQIRDRFKGDSGRKFILREIAEFVSDAPQNDAQQNSYKYKCTFEELSDEIYKDAEDNACPHQVQALPR